MLTERECSKAQAILCEYKDYPDEVDGDDVSWAVSVFAELIHHHHFNDSSNEELLGKHQQLERALYKACAIIDGNFGTCPFGQFDIELSQCKNNCQNNSVNCWVEWLLKEDKVNE